MQDNRRDRNIPLFNKGDMPPELTPSLYSEYVSSNWQQMAAIAYGGYLHEDKGILIVDWDCQMSRTFNILPQATLREIQGNPVAGYRTFPVFYCGYSNPLLKASSEGAFIGSLKGAVERYEPEKSIILALSWDFDLAKQKGQMSYKTLTSQTLTPIALYERDRLKLSEMFL